MQVASHSDQRARFNWDLGAWERIILFTLVGLALAPEAHARKKCAEKEVLAPNFFERKCKEPIA